MSGPVIGLLVFFGIMAFMMYKSIFTPNPNTRVSPRKK
jgi:hypothetical protein